jgi:hypothetical protein
VPERAFSHDGDLRTGSRPALRRIDSRTDANFESRGPIKAEVYRANPHGASASRPIRHLITAGQRSCEARQMQQSPAAKMARMNRATFQPIFRRYIALLVL